MLVLLTGATGFVGGAIARTLLTRGQRLRTVCRNVAKGEALAALGLDVITGDVRDAAIVKRAVLGVDAVVHAAGRTIEPASGDFVHANVETTRAVLEAAASAPSVKRLVFISSLAAVGPAPRGTELTEESACRPVSAYGRSKYNAESLVRAFGDRLGFTIVRAPLVYGPGDTKLGPLFKLAKVGVLPTVGHDETHVSLLHTNDLADGVAIAVMHDGAANQTFNFAEPQAPSVRELLTAIGKAVGCDVTVLRVPALLALGAALVAEGAGRIRQRLSAFNPDSLNDLLGDNWVCSTTHAHDTLGFTPSHTFRQGFEQSAAWYLK
jgi:nucleoside-diphosphate-sugar epimerase